MDFWVDYIGRGVVVLANASMALALSLRCNLVSTMLVQAGVQN